MGSGMKAYTRMYVSGKLVAGAAHRLHPWNYNWWRLHRTDRFELGGIGSETVTVWTRA